MAKSSEVLLAFNELTQSRELPPERILEALRDALVAAYRKIYNAPASQQVEVDFDLPNGRITLLVEKEVVEEVQDPRTEISLDEARRFKPDAQVGEIVMVPMNPSTFGRIAAQVSRQVIKQRLQDAERQMQYEYYSQLKGEIVHGIIQAINPVEIVVGLDKRAEGRLPRKEQIPGERFQVHDRIRALLLDVEMTPRGPQITLSRAHPNFLKRLLEEEVPEIHRGEVEIRAVAREAGRRSKVAVSAIAPNIDPVGACVGIRGSRIQTIMRELNNEKIDIIEWDPNPAVFIAKALSPARVLGVYLQEGDGPRTAMVVVPEDNLSLAIGREGQNVRLAAKLTRWRIDIKSVAEAAQDALDKLYRSEEFADILAEERETLEQVEAILEKKQAGRPLTPEEYNFLFQFVDRVERGMLAQLRARREAEAAALAELRRGIPEAAFETPLDTLGLTPRLIMSLTEAGYHSVGDLIVALRQDPDAILGLQGVGPRTMETLQQAIEAYLAEHAAEAEAEEAARAAEAAAQAALTEAEAAEVPPAVDEVEGLEAPAPAEAEPVPQAEEEAPTPAETVPEPAVADLIVAEAEPLPAAEAEPIPQAAEEAPPAEAVEERPLEELFSAERLFQVPDEVLAEEDAAEEEPAAAEPAKKKKKKRKKRRYVELDFDEEGDYFVTRRRKRGDGDWEEW